MPDEKITTKKQRRAEAAYARIRKVGEKDEDYARLAKKFPALVHTCGLVQATAFVLAKEKDSDEAKKNSRSIGIQYLSDLTYVMGYPDDTDLHTLSRTADMLAYQRMTQEAIDSASWLKRYAEAFIKDV
jgi:CRISPR-associated protein Cmr5